MVAQSMNPEYSTRAEAGMIIVMGCSAQGFCPAPLLNKVVDWELKTRKTSR